MNRAILAFVASVVVFASGCSQGRPNDPLAEQQQAELSTLAGQIADPARSARTRTEASSLLLTRPYPAARAALMNFLTDASNPSARIAVAEAIAGYHGQREAFVQPLLGMLSAGEVDVRAAAARALGSSNTPAILETLINLAEDARADRQGRLGAVSALQFTLDKHAIESLVGLLSDTDPAIRAGALRALEGVTYEDLGDDPAAWRAWWASRRNKEWSRWLAEWASNLNRRHRQLAADNAALRARLAEAMRDVYATGSEIQREEMLAKACGDEVSEVRLVALELIERRVAGDEPVSGELRGRIRQLLADTDARIRRAAALLLANLRDSESVDALLARLTAEPAGQVRHAILTALGLLCDPKATPAIIASLAGAEGVAAAAASALARIADKQPLDEQTRAEAAEALLSRYGRTSPDNGDAPVLREAILRAMGFVGAEQFVPVMTQALADPAATVRLAAVNGLAKQGRPASVERIKPLLADPDRGVREAAITAVGRLGGASYLEAIYSRTDASIEPDSAVRQRAWAEAMKLLASAEAEVLSDLAAKLRGRPEGIARRVEILQILVEKLTGGDAEVAAGAKRRLGLALIEAGRPAEAAPHLAGAYEALAGAAAPEAMAVWTEWLEALLAAEDPGLIVAIAAQEDSHTFEVAIELLQGHLLSLLEADRLSACILLASEALKELPDRLSFEQREAISKLLAGAADRQLAESRRQVAVLVRQLTAGDEAAEKAAAKIQEMAEQAVAPLLEELARAASAEPADRELEKAILDVLGRVTPQLTGYDPEAPIEERLELLESWREQI